MESILDSIDEEEEFSFEDVEMMDIEEGQVLDNHKPQLACPNNSNTNNNNKKKNKKKKKKNKKKNSGAVPTSDAIDIDRFVLSACKRLREKKSYLVYTAVGVLGVSALSQLLKEVDAVQACGGQKTVLGDRNRTGGGILWNILKARDPHAFKEIMKKGKDFEKQFRRPNSFGQLGATASKPVDTASEDNFTVKCSSLVDSAQQSIKEKRGPVHDRIRVPVSYDDLPAVEPPIDH